MICRATANHAYQGRTEGTAGPALLGFGWSADYDCVQVQTLERA